LSRIITQKVKTATATKSPFSKIAVCVILLVWVLVWVGGGRKKKTHPCSFPLHAATVETIGNSNPNTQPLRAAAVNLNGITPQQPLRVLLCVSLAYS